MNWQDRIVDIRKVPASELRANPSNWRTHPPAQRAALGELLDQVGIVAPLLLNQRSAAAGWPEEEQPTLIDGHLRQDMAEGDQVVPVVMLDLSPQEEALVLATLDPVGAMAGADGERVAELLARVGEQPDHIASLIAQVADASGAIAPGFIPESEPPRGLDEKRKATCPECGHEFEI